MSRDRLAKHRGRVVATEAALWLVLLIVASAGLFLMGMQALGTVGCAGICRDDLVRGSFWILFAGLPIALVLAIVVRIVLSKRRRSPLWGPLAGSALVIAVTATSFVTLQAGYAPMYERNERTAELQAPFGTSYNP